MFYYIYRGDFGEFLIIEEEGCIVGLGPYKKENLEGMEEKNTDLIKKTVGELDEYFMGERREFTIKINPKGTDFQKRVWKELLKIGYGEVKSYKDIATSLGNPKASRAVGSANNKNPLAIIIPCHRVVGSDGSLVGYAGGLKMKEDLLRLEEENKKY